MISPLVILAFGAVHIPLPFADYVFQIPVRIENMRHVTEASASCSILHESPGRGPIQLGVPGTGYTSIPVVDGAVNDTITVTVTVTAARIAEYTPTHWDCGLAYRWRNPDGTIFSESLIPGTREGIYTRLTGQEITTAVVQVRGELSPP